MNKVTSESNGAKEVILDTPEYTTQLSGPYDDLLDALREAYQDERSRAFSDIRELSRGFHTEKQRANDPNYQWFLGYATGGLLGIGKAIEIVRNAKQNTETPTDQSQE